MMIVWPCILLVSFTLLVSIPLVPAWRALRHSPRAERLLISQQRTDNGRYFTDQFFSHVLKDFGNDIERQFEQWHSSDRHFVYLKKYLVIGGKQHPDWREWQHMANSRQLITVLGGSARLPNHSVWLHDIFCTREAEMGHRSTLRAVRSNRYLILRPGCVVIRWVDADVLHVDEGCELHGRATARTHMNLAGGVRFERLFAPCIKVINNQPEVAAHPDSSSLATAPDQDPSSHGHETLISLDQPDTGHTVSGRHSTAGDLYIPALSTLQCDIVCGGTLRIGRGSRLIGHIKSHGDIVCQPDVTIDGTLISDSNIWLDHGCHVSQLLVADQAAHLAQDCTLGQPDAYGTLSADTVNLASGVQVFGSIVARNGGLTTP